MTEIVGRNLGSFRDPSGYVFQQKSRVFRSINASGLTNFQAANALGIFQLGISNKLLIPFEVVDDETSKQLSESIIGARGEFAKSLIEHPKISLISYPYEWVFSQLKDAALAHLDLQILLLNKDFELSDASAFNMQFFEGQMRHIDLLSIRPYIEGRPWEGYHQFCKQFLAPLILESTLGIPFQRLYRGSIAGLDIREIVSLMPAWRRYSSLNIFMHLQLQAMSLGNYNSSNTSITSSKIPYIPKNRYLALITGLREWIADLKSSRRVQSYWSDYSSKNSYDDLQRIEKIEFIKTHIQQWRPDTVADIGGNSGDYSEVALMAGAKQAFCLDTDLDALEFAYKKYLSSSKNALPLYVDCCDPTPSQGWNSKERSGINQRLKVDCVMALALIHHVVIANNIPMTEFLDWIFERAPKVIIEFVPKSDPMVIGLLHNRDDIFEDYSNGNFLAHLTQRANIISSHHISNSHRIIYACESKNAAPL